MSIRVTVLYIIVVGLSIYAWKDWFKSLCGLILLMAVIEHRDMPAMLFGIQGLNPWNVLFFTIVLAWRVNRGRQGLKWDMPRHVSVFLLMFLGVVVIGFLRLVFDRGHLQGYPLSRLISDDLINTIKWILPGVLLFDGCRTRRQAIIAITCLLAMYFLIAVQVVRVMPLEAIFVDNGSMDRSRLKLDKYTGYNAVDISTFLAGVSWGILATLPLIHKKKHWVIVLPAIGVVILGQALTGGRAGYVAWGATGLVLCLLKWRRYLLLAPVVVFLLPIVFPGAAARMLSGFGETDEAGQKTIDEEAISSGRLQVWPYVIDEIGKSPWVGYGRRGMETSGLREFLERVIGKSQFGHPHNMYLETLLDNGILGSIPIFLLWGTAILYSARLFRSNNRLSAAVGGLALALTVAQLIGGIGAQHVYPRQSTVGMWVAIFLALRVYVEDKRAQESVKW